VYPVEILLRARISMAVRDRAYHLLKRYQRRERTIDICRHSFAPISAQKIGIAPHPRDLRRVLYKGESQNLRPDDGVVSKIRFWIASKIGNDLSFGYSVLIFKEVGNYACLGQPSILFGAAIYVSTDTQKPWMN